LKEQGMSKAIDAMVGVPESQIEEAMR